MEKSSLFLRGQVWYWEDPIYGKKEQGIEVPLGETTLRYSRYVIVVQTQETLGRGSVLVTPCSSSNNAPHDVQIPLSHVFNEDISYAKTRCTTPVHIRYLQRYICTLPDSVMKKIEAEYLKLLVPSIRYIMTDDEILEKFGIDMNNQNEHEDTFAKQSLDQSIYTFAKESLVRTGNDENTISIYEMKTAFDNYCRTNTLVNTDDLIEFIELFNRIPGSIDPRISYDDRNNIKFWSGLRFRKEIIPIIPAEIDLVNESDPQRQGRWSDECIDEFVKFYKNNGSAKAAEEFGIKESTAISYWYKWKSRKPALPKINTDQIHRSASKMANIIRDTFLLRHLFERISKSSSDIGDSTDFYYRLGVFIYYSMLNFLCIRRVNTSEYVYPIINEETESISTWHFLDKIYHDRRISYTKNGEVLMKVYRNYYGEEFTGINLSWLPRLKERLITGFKDELTEEIIDTMIDDVKNTFCEIPQK